MKRIAGVSVPDKMTPPPERHEVEIAWILARHYNLTVEFIRPTDGYKSKTPDAVMNGSLWEFKSPKGSSRKYTIQFQIKVALKQSRNVVIDGRRTKLPDNFIHKQIKLEIARHSKVGRVLFITKSNEVIEFEKK